MRRIACALLHYPILDRGGGVVTTAITNLDLHDIARSAHCYGLENYFVVHPIHAQRQLAERVRAHWTSGGSGEKRIPDRGPALQGLRVVGDLDEAITQFARGDAVELWSTSAKVGPELLAHRQGRAALQQPGPPVLLLFGTGWGLAPEVLERCHAQLAPIISPRTDGYNHLSVRAAAAILFDRLLAPAAS